MTRKGGKETEAIQVRRKKKEGYHRGEQRQSSLEEENEQL